MQLKYVWFAQILKVKKGNPSMGTKQQASRQFGWYKVITWMDGFILSLLCHTHVQIFQKDEMKTKTKNQTNKVL